MQIIPSLIDRDIYFLFRDNNEEIKIIVSGRRIFNSRPITREERKYINDKFIKGAQTPSIHLKLNKLNETQLKDVELKIDKLLNLTQ